ncbi:TonB-dependent receptor [Novosphingobium sp. ST904]|uniref:TonB-dependent receptor n=1 Tax=Novosphingobium sp. ST904 TaxID=1684385 RepID=UPI0010EC529A|nr:TonB-dependent receptor [Novosphingobium sp. ST904]TCM35430.1 outer membrane receptor protein involved in Fe transport [Novosphingobium sp. ST904]
MMGSRNTIKGAILSSTVLALGLAAPAHAQQASETGMGKDDIIVTATKRELKLSDVPMPISAVSGDQLKAMNANSLADYITRLPGVVFNDYQPGISEVVIRGIAATTYHEQGQTTVGYYLNEVPLVEPGFPIGIPDIDTFDLQRVEVLRGPQGTLFGTSTLGGAVNYVAAVADPGKFDAAAEGLLGSTRNASGQLNYAAKAMINLPLVKDQLAVRVMALQRVDAGYLDNPGIGVNGSNDYRTRGLRGSLVATPNDTTKLTFLTTYQDTRLDDQTYLDLDNPYVRDTPRAEPQKTDFWMNSLRLDQELPFANLTVLGSITEKHNTTLFSYPYAYVTGVTTGDDAAYSLGKANANIKSFETRLASKDGGPFQWLIGFSYMKAKKHSADRIYQGGAADFIDANPDLYGGYSGDLIAPNDAIYGYLSDTSNENWGVFGEASWEFVPTVTLTLGGRYYNTRNSAEITNAPGSLAPGSYTIAPSSFGVKQKEDGFTPKVSLSWKPGETMLAYATYSQGYREGGPNPNAAILTGIPTSYKSDTVDNYEAGVKTSLFGNRLTIDMAAFHIEWNDIQARLFTDAPYYYSYVTNAGGAKIDGVEFSGALQINSIVSFSSNVTYQDARLSKFLPDTFAVGGGYDKGTTLPGSSKWSVANNLRFELADVTGAPSLEIAHRYLSKAPVAFGNDARRGGFNVFDLRASMGLGENIRVMAFANNVFDKFGILNAPFTSQAVPAGSIIRPRTIGVKLDWSL